MPYYVYQVTPGPTNILKQLKLEATFELYREAKNYLKEQRKKLASDSRHSYQVVFAANALQAEEQLMEKREAPILQEWEK